MPETGKRNALSRRGWYRKQARIERIATAHQRGNPQPLGLAPGHNMTGEGRQARDEELRIVGFFRQIVVIMPPISIAPSPMARL